MICYFCMEKLLRSEDKVWYKNNKLLLLILNVKFFIIFCWYLYFMFVIVFYIIKFVGYVDELG